MTVNNKKRTQGIRKIISDIYSYQIDKYLLKLLKFFLKKRPLKDVILIESHNDFDCNGGAFFDFLVKNGYNEKYKIVWLLKHPEKKPIDLPINVECYPLLKPSIKKDYYNIVAKFMTFDSWPLHKQNSLQKSFFFTHGCGGLKNVKGAMIIPDDVDYILLQSETYAPIQAEQYSLSYPSDRLVYLGYPAHDVLHNANKTEIKKVTNKEYNKVIIWMPTFRKGGGKGRNDSTKEQPLGIPLIESLSEYTVLNEFLKDNDAFLIIKLHPMQDLENVKIKSMSNIEVLTGDDVKNKDIDNYRLLPCTDAMISDYSGIAYEYLQLDKPIAYVLEDMKEYKLGFVLDDIDPILAGQKIFVFKDLLNFIQDVVRGEDKFYEKRHKVRKYIYKYHDGNSCQRIADFMGLKK